MQSKNDDDVYAELRELLKSENPEENIKVTLAMCAASSEVRKQLLQLDYSCKNEFNPGVYGLSISSGEDVPLVSEVLKRGWHFQVLSFSNISEGAIQTIFAALQESSHVERIWFQNIAVLKNEIYKLCEQGEEAVTRTLGNAKELMIRGCGLDDDVLEILAPMIKSERLEFINFRGNEIGNRGAIALANALKSTKLTHLYLSENKIGNDGAKALIEEAQKKNSCFSLSLMDNQIDDIGVGAQTKGLYLSLYGNPIYQRRKM